MKPLSSEFTRDDFHFRQLAREGDVALFEKSKAGHSCPCYEVVVVQCHPAQTIHGREYLERESMPPNESWGESGWSYSYLPSAQTKFDELVANRTDARFRSTPFPADASQAAGCRVTNTPPPASPRGKG